MESWDSSNAEHRFSDNSELTKDLTVTEHPHHEISAISSPRSSFEVQFKFSKRKKVFLFCLV